MPFLLLALMLCSATSAAHAADCPPLVPLRLEVTSEIVRSEVGFTQGLEWHNGQLYESTGPIGGSSGLNVISAEGSVRNLVNQGTTVFGEGLTILNGELFQLTWKNHVVHVFDLSGKLKRTMRNPREGWGLTNDGRELIFSDGGPSLYFADPLTFAITREVKLKTDRPGDIRGVNELELVDNKLYANIYLTRTILRIDLQSGCVDGSADMESVWLLIAATGKPMRPDVDVLNGIAYNKANGLFYLTGKRWPKIFAGRFVEQP